jgi:hypothetical protein
LCASCDTDVTPIRATIHGVPALQLLRVMTGTPNLPGAACVTHRDIFDACTDRRARFAYRHAIHICTGCPVLAQCSAWITSLPPSQPPFGVTAGRIRQQQRR